jgi:uncharacterized protein YegL
MSLDGKIEALNAAVREALPHMQGVADENPNASVLVRAARFSHGAQWHVAQPTALETFRWTDLVADPMDRPAVDIVFMMDTSGSMGDEIKAVRQSCTQFADSIISAGANVRLGLVGFDIGGHRKSGQFPYTVHNLSHYTIGVWPLTSPDAFKSNVQSLTLRLFGGSGCYLANHDTVDIFPHIVRAFSGPPENQRVLVIISDEIGKAEGVPAIVEELKRGGITAHVLGVPRQGRGAHEQIAQGTGGFFWDITHTKGAQSFGGLLDTVAQAIAGEVSQRLADGTTSAGTDMGAAMNLVAAQLRIPPMDERALPPVLVLISDGLPTDDLDAGLGTLMALPWGKKAVRVAIAIGRDADLAVLKRFIGRGELEPLQANNPDALVHYIKWISTAVLSTASSPRSQAIGVGGSPFANVPIPVPMLAQDAVIGANDVW